MGMIIRWFAYGPDVLTVAEFARIAGISQTTVRRLIARRELHGFQKSDYPMLIPYEAARRWLEGVPATRGTVYELTIHL